LHQAQSPIRGCVAPACGHLEEEEKAMIYYGIKSSAASLAALAFLLAAPNTTLAQDRYPSRPIKLIVPYAAGGLADLLARMVGEKLAAKWGQPVIVEARPGASGNIGAEAVARAEPDGYTLLVTPPPPLAINQSLFSRLGYDPNAFVPLCLVATIPNILVINPNVPASNIHELVAFAKANPDKLSYASTGSGGTPHLTAEMLKVRAGLRIMHVPYKGNPPAFTDLIGGHVDMMFANLGDSLPHFKSNKLKVLGVGSRTRLAELPDVPAISEAFPGFVSDTWYAVVAPPKTPAAIAAQLSTAINESLKLPDVASRLRDLSAAAGGGSPTETAAFISEETRRWREVIVAAGIKSE